jgi:hypothetical protein
MKNENDCVSYSDSDDDVVLRNRSRPPFKGLQPAACPRQKELKVVAISFRFILFQNPNIFEFDLFVLIILPRSANALQLNTQQRKETNRILPQ